MTGLVLLPNAKQQFVDGNGAPLAAGSVYMYVPNTSPPVFATTWQDMGQIAENENPITLDADGRAIIWGDGIYRQVVYDVNGVLIWDEETSSPSNVNALNLVELPVYIEAAPANNEIYPRYNITTPRSLPAGLTGSVFSISTLPTAPTVWSLYKLSSGVSTLLGTITFDTGGAATVSFINTVVFNAADQFYLQAQTMADATAAQAAFTFVFTLVT